MKNAIRLGVALVVLLLALTSCSLFQAINLDWGDPLISGNGAHTLVTYTVYNYGKYDLTGVNLLIGLDTTNDGLYDFSGWTSDFSVSQSNPATISLDFVGVAWVSTHNAYVLSVDMDKP